GPQRGRHRIAAVQGADLDLVSPIREQLGDPRRALEGGVLQDDGALHGDCQQRSDCAERETGARDGGHDRRKRDARDRWNRRRSWPTVSGWERRPFEIRGATVKHPRTMNDRDTTESAAPKSPGLDFIRQRITAELAEGKGGGRVHTRFPPEPNGYLHV